MILPGLLGLPGLPGLPGLLGLLGLLILVLLVGCDDSVVEVTVTDIPSDARALRVRARLDDRDSDPPLRHYPSTQTRFGIELSGGAGGALAVTVEALRDDGCVLGDARGTVEVRRGAFPDRHRTLPLRVERGGRQDKEPLRCPLRLSLEGPGSLTVQSPSGIPCSAGCTPDIEVGAEVQVLAQPQGGAYLSRWLPSQAVCPDQALRLVMPKVAVTHTARFAAQPPLALRLLGDGQGQVQIGPVGGAQIDVTSSGQIPVLPCSTVTLIPRAAARSYFDGFRGGGCAGSGRCSVLIGETAPQIDAVFSPKVCSAQGWCVDRPLPGDDTSKDLLGLAGGAELTLAVGAGGLIFRHDPEARRWREEPSGTQEELRSVWVGAGGLAFAVGTGGAILRRSGSPAMAGTWESRSDGMQKQTLFDVWGSGGQVWIVGVNSTILFGDGPPWMTKGPLPQLTPLNTVFGAAGEVFVAGAPVQAQGTLFAVSEASAEVVPHSQSPVINIYKLWGRPDGEWLAVGPGGILSRQGSRWVQLTEAPAGRWWSVSGDQAGEVFVVGEGGALLWRRSQRAAFERHELGRVEDLRRVAVAPRGTWIVGTRGLILSRE